jgi:hypothetical protein
MPTRRKALIAIGGTVAIAGCSGTEESDFEEGDVNNEEESEPQEETEPSNEEETEQQEEPAEANFEFTEIIGDGETYSVGDEVEAGVVIENTGDASGSANLQVTLSEGTTGLSESTGGELELEPGEEYESSSTSVYDTAGEYEIEFTIDGKSETVSFTVEGPSEEDIELVEHEYVVEEGEYTEEVYVEGEVANNADTIASYVEVTVRLFNDEGNQIGTSFTNISDLAANTTWEFRVDIFEDSENIDDYDIAVEDVRF